MMKSIIIFLILKISLFASLKTAQEFFKNKEYEKAIQEAKSSKDEYSNPLLHLVWAQSAQELGLENDAMSAYERVVMLDEGNAEAKIALMRIYRETERDDLAVDTGKELQNYQLTPEQRMALELLQGVSIYSVKAKASFNIGYDSNINSNPGGGVLDDYYGISGSGGEISTMFSRFTANVSYINELDENGGWHLRADARVYYQSNFSAHKFDMFVGSLETGIGYKGDNYTIYLPLIYDKINYLDLSLMQQYKFEPRANITISKNLIVNINAKYGQRAYIVNSFKDRDDYVIGAGIGAYYLIGKDFVYANIKYEEFKPQNNISPKFVEKDIFTLSAGVNYNLESWLVTRLDYTYRNGKYSDNIGSPLNIDITKRSDNYHQVELKLSHFFAQRYEVFISDRQAKNNSNYLPSEYDKNIAMFGISVNY